jgi:hypothetical protein
MYLTFFRNNGINAAIDSDGDVGFEWKSERLSPLNLYIMVDEDDQQYFRIEMFSGYSLNTAQARRQALFAASAATRDAFVAKLFVNGNGDNIGVRAGAFVVSPGDFEAVFFKLMEGIEQVLLSFLYYMG